MKRVLTIFLAVLMIFGLCACGAEEPQKTGEDTPVTAPETVVKETEEEKTEPKKEEPEEEALEKFKFPMATIYCKVPEGGIRKTNANFAVWLQNEAYLPTIFNGMKGSYTGNMEDYFAEISKEYARLADKYLSPEINADQFQVKSEKKVTISGNDATKLEGQVGNEDGKSYQLYGYATMVDDMPTVIMGILVTEEQGSKDLNEMKAVIDQMANTIYK